MLTIKERQAKIIVFMCIELTYDGYNMDGSYKRFNERGVFLELLFLIVLLVFVLVRARFTIYFVVVDVSCKDIS